jgi:hypothetical protein
MCDSIGHHLIVSPPISRNCICCLFANFSVSANKYQIGRIVMGAFVLHGFLGIFTV